MHRLFVPALILLGALGVAQAAWPSPQAQNTQSRVVRGTAVVRDVYGVAQQRKGDSGDWKRLNAGDTLTTHTSVKTAGSAAILLQLSGGHLFRVGENTTVELRELGRDKSFSFHVLAGNIWSVVRKAFQPTKYEVETPSAVAGVSGTVFAVFHNSASGQTTVSTNLGQVDVRQLNAQNETDGTPVPVGDGQFTQISRGTQVGTTNVPGPPSIHARPQSPAFRQMWRTMHQEEGWIQPLNSRAPFKLNPKIEPALRHTVFAPARVIPRASQSPTRRSPAFRPHRK